MHILTINYTYNNPFPSINITYPKYIQSKKKTKTKENTIGKLFEHDIGQCSSSNKSILTSKYKHLWCNLSQVIGEVT